MMASFKILALALIVAVNGQMDMMPMPDAFGVYYLEACEGMDMKLMCPDATEIRILDGFFGRDNNRTCQVQGKDMSNTNCIVTKTTVLERLRMGCEGKISCQVPATIETFTSPCSTNVAKYARVSYTCIASTHRVEVCSVRDSSKVQICCPDNRIIVTQNVFYGRSDAHDICRSEFNSASNKTNCSGLNALGIAQEMCDGQQSCEMDVSVLGPACGGRSTDYRYLAINYTCQECRNDYGDDGVCTYWANQGECYNNPSWMYSRCRKACFRCDDVKPAPASTTPECANRMDDVQCEGWAASGECNNNAAFMLAYCRKTCMACGLKTDCIDRHSSCQAWADEGQCTTNPGYMLPMCRKSCFQCSTIVPCMDKAEYAAQCPAWAASGECESNSGFMLAFCTKSCLNCTTSPMCTNKHPNENDCLNWANLDNQCVTNPVWMHQNCWADCVGCLREPVCVNYHGNDAECDWWWYTGETSKDPTFMMFNCLKSVTRCRPKDYVKPDMCRNYIANDTMCMQYANSGECQTNAIWMMKNCYKACTKCDQPKTTMRVGGCMRGGPAYSADYATNVILPYQFSMDGALQQFSGVFVNTERIRIGVWRKAGSSWVEIYGQDFTPKGMMTLQTIPVTSCINVMAGDRIGFTKTNYSPYPFAYGSNKMWTSDNKMYVRPTTSGNFVGYPTCYNFAVDAVVSKTKC